MKSRPSELKSELVTDNANLLRGIDWAEQPQQPETMLIVDNTQQTLVTSYIGCNTEYNYYSL
jgi:hypothetical protein